MLSDAYSEGLLTAEYKGAATASEKKALLKRILRTGAHVPLSVAEAAFTDTETSVRIYSASHMHPVYKDYAGDWENPKLLRDFAEVTGNDPDPLVRAALLSNPHISHVWTFSNTDAGCQKALSGLTQLERFAALRNPKLNPRFVIGLMNEKAADMNMTAQDQMELIEVAVTNPHIVEGSRRTGRDYWKTFDGDYESPFEEYGRIWQLAVDCWLKESGWGSQAIPNLVFKYVQTTPAIKLNIYKKLSAQKYAHLRRTILESCEPMSDKDVLKLGWSDPDEECRKVARERIGRYTKWLGVKPRIFAASAK